MAIRSGPSWFNRPGGMTNDVGNIYGGGSNPSPMSPMKSNAMRRPMNRMSGGGGMSGGMRQSVAPSPAPVTTAPSTPPMAAGGFKSPWKNGGFSPGFNFADPQAAENLKRMAIPTTPSPEFVGSGGGPINMSGGMVANNAPNMFSGATPYGNDAFIGNPSGMDNLKNRMGNGNTGIYGKNVGVGRYY